MQPKRVNIAIASPGDVTAERDAVLRVFTRWNGAKDHAFLHPVMWEHSSAPALGGHPQTLLNKTIIDKSDLLLAILWSKLGTPTPTARSGTVEEIREFVMYKGPGRVMLYFCTRDLPHNIDPAELIKLREFKAEVQGQGVYHEYKTVDQFESDLYHHLDLKVQELLTGQLPLPTLKREDTPQSRTSIKPGAADARLHQPIEFGNSLEVIANGFETRMAQFRAINGGGKDKYLDRMSLESP